MILFYLVLTHFSAARGFFLYRERLSGQSDKGCNDKNVIVFGVVAVAYCNIYTQRYRIKHNVPDTRLEQRSVTSNPRKTFAQSKDKMAFCITPSKLENYPQHFSTTNANEDQTLFGHVKQKWI
uniref:Secreted protein n=1 Tax=Steinernema glaseri TaxID=37863 RepID=A0A1I7Z4L9_9BILA